MTSRSLNVHFIVYALYPIVIIANIHTFYEFSGKKHSLQANFFDFKNYLIYKSLRFRICKSLD